MQPWNPDFARPQTQSLRHCPILDGNMATRHRNMATRHGRSGCDQRELPDAVAAIASPPKSGSAARTLTYATARYWAGVTKSGSRKFAVDEVRRPDTNSRDKRKKSV